MDDQSGKSTFLSLLTMYSNIPILCLFYIFFFGQTFYRIIYSLLQNGSNVPGASWGVEMTELDDFKSVTLVWPSTAVPVSHVSYSMGKLIAPPCHGSSHSANSLQLSLYTFFLFTFSFSLFHHLFLYLLLTLINAFSNLQSIIFFSLSFHCYFVDFLWLD